LAGNIKKGPTSKSYACYCGPAFQKFEKKLERDKRELLKHIDSSHSKLDSKISHLEKKTKDQVFNLNQSMKESFATERSECMDRMDRRALRERIAIERQQAVRDISLKRDLASWLDKKLREIETKHGADGKNSALLRTMALRAAGKRAKNSGITGLDVGTLRRAMSEELLSDVGLNEDARPVLREETTSVYKGLIVSDTPSTRVRRNSAGDECLDPAPSPLLREHDGEHEFNQDILAYSTNSESYLDTSHSERGSSITSRESRSKPQQRPESVVSPSSASQNKGKGSKSDLNPSGGTGTKRNGLIRPIPMCFSSENIHTLIPPIEELNLNQTNYKTSQEGLNLSFKTQMPPIRRFSTEADIHHATPLMLEPEPEPYENEFQQSYLQPELNLPPYRAPPTLNPVPPHLYHPRDRLGQGPLLPPVDEDEYSGEQDEEKEQDLHRQLLNLPLHSDGGSHDSHNDSGYSTRFGASAGPSPSLSGN